MTYKIVVHAGSGEEEAAVIAELLKRLSHDGLDWLSGKPIIRKGGGLALQDEPICVEVYSKGAEHHQSCTAVSLVCDDLRRRSRRFKGKIFNIVEIKVVHCIQLSPH